MRKNELRIIFTGAPGCGKTTAVHALNTLSSIGAAHVDKRLTTIGQDYAEVMLGEDIIMRCYGTPGQARFAFIWELLALKANGIVIVVDSARQTPLVDMQMYLDNFHELIERTAAVICVVKSGGPAAPLVADYEAHLEKAGLDLPVLFADNRKQEDMLIVVNELLKQLADKV